MTREKEITSIFTSIAALVVEKNRRYGDSALDPVKVFARSIGQSDAIRIRLDDKLARIKNSGELRKNDIADIMGYLCLLCISEGWEDFSDLID